MFNTGDLVRWREDGSLETFGRADDQVKIKVRRLLLINLIFTDRTRASELNWTASLQSLR